MARIARNALKGYTYQQYITTYFIAKMDTEREISCVESEAIVPHNMDDIVLSINDEKYYIQSKNYPDTTLDDIEQENDFEIKVSSKIIKLSNEKTNLVIINIQNLPINSSILGLDAYKLKNVYIVPLTTEKIDDIIDSMYGVPLRLNRIVTLSYKKISAGIFKVTQDDLPPLPTFSIDLNERTVYLRSLISIDKGILCIMDKPGVGKSHFVEELRKKYPEAKIYRFWIGSQDSYRNERLQFKFFINDLAMKIFNTPKAYTEEQIIDKINKTSPIIIIDGLDHIENYNKHDLEKYISFIDSINEANILILTRPLNTEIQWNTVPLGNWSKDETLNYLSDSYDIKYPIGSDIFKVTQGYPIITNYLAQHYKKYSTLNITTEIKEINEYYNELISDIKVRSLISLFLMNYSFFTDEEIDNLLDSDIEREAIKEFIAAYPYLFQRYGNRLSLFHDSLNSYILKYNPPTDSFKERILSNIKENIISGNIEYLSRIESFNFDTEFKKEILIKYSNFDLFTNLLSENYDFESVKEFYLQLKSLLEFIPGTLNIYQYYSLILITQIIERNDFVGYDCLLIQQIKYILEHDISEKDIYSNGTLWAIFCIMKLGDNEGLLLKNIYSNHHYGVTHEFNQFCENFKKEYHYFDLLKDVPKVEQIIGNIKKEPDPLKKRGFIIKLFATVHMKKITTVPWYKNLENCLNEIEGTEDILSIHMLYSECGINNRHFAIDIIPQTKFLVYSLGGVLKDQNLFKGKSLEQLINEYGSEGSFTRYEYVTSYIRLANHEKRDIDIKSIWKFYFMYYMRKDATVISLPEVLVTFEKHGLIDEFDSLEIILSVMAMSEKGIRSLLVNYLNLKEIKFIEKCLEIGIFDGNYPIDIFYLDSDKISCLNEYHIIERMTDLLEYHSYGKSIDYSDIQNVLDSKYREQVLEIIKRAKYSISKIPEEYTSKIPGIGYTLAEKKEERKILAEGHIARSDLPYILQNNIPHLEISRYTDDGYFCFGDLELYKHYNYEDLKQDLLEIIHASLFAKIPNIGYLGYWHLYFGNIPVFLDMIEYDVDWKQLYNISLSFLKTSLIPVPNQ